jgi:hypothetical protein
MFARCQFELLMAQESTKKPPDWSGDISGRDGSGEGRRLMLAGACTKRANHRHEGVEIDRLLENGGWRRPRPAVVDPGQDDRRDRRDQRVVLLFFPERPLFITGIVNRARSPMPRRRL